ncbi:MAG: DEAD/DEAH box helicase [Dehalococcoidia bacterium]|nr:DEAD/DEAH box helicase [Dehalococcoidia bacterium]
MPPRAPGSSALDRFSPVARHWFVDAFERPTEAQELGWDAISGGQHTLLLAPTGSGKTLAAFLWCLDQLIQREPISPRKDGRPGKRAGVSVLYISPLKALSYDVERNLRAPLAGLRLAAAREGLAPPDITVATRTGDTPAREREDIRRDPPDILITTPESLYLMLTSRARSVLETVTTVIVDEIHTMAATKRGAHLALSLERLERVCTRPPQRIGLSATQRPLEEVAKYLGGDREVAIADAGARKELDLKVIVPVEDMDRPVLDGYTLPDPQTAATGNEGHTSVWPAIYPELLALVRAHRSTLIFVNNRRLAERLALRINELAGEELLRAHHGSVSREQRQEVEERLKAGLIPGLVATSSLELGIDMGAVDLVVQVESPKSVARGLQRVGRAGHQVGAPSRGRIFPKFRGDLLECAVITKRMREGQIERTTVPKNPLDVLAQQIVAICAVEDLTVDELEQLVRRTYNFATISRDVLESVLGMLAGQYPSDEFADLRPRVLWDRATDVLSSRRDARTIAVVNAGTIPDRGLYGVFLGDGGPRVGELDEEMVYESRPGETFMLGATTWRIEQITRDRVIVSPAAGEPGKMPFWKGDGVGRELDFGRAIGAFTRELDALPEERAVSLLEAEHDLDELAARNLVAYLDEEKQAAGALPTDRTIVVERFRDELGDWRVVVLTPFGGRVHAPWAQAIEARLAERTGFDIQTIWSDDGIALRYAGGDEPPPDDLMFPEPEEVEELVTGRLADTPLFASHFRENAARALLLPRRRPGARMPLWLQRQRSANLLGVASRYGSFPIILETYRECLRDVFDLPGLQEVLTQVRSREIRIRSVELTEASPFARGLLFDYIAAYMYEGDAPLAERRAQALTLDRNLLRDLLGDDELRELLDPVALEQIELELQGLADGRKARNPDQLHDLLRRVGDLAEHEVAARITAPAEAAAWLRVLEDTRRACRVRIAGDERCIPIEDAGRYRDALGVAPPIGVPETFLRPTANALEGLTGRYARTHGPFLARDPASRWAVPESLIRDALAALERAGTVVHGDFRPGGTEREWCDADALRQLRRRSLARLRKDVEPVSHDAFARFLLKWQGVGSQRTGLDRAREAVAQLEGVPLPVSVLERDVLAARVAGYQPRLLDELGANGEVAWVGRGTLGRDDGRIALYARERLPELAPPPAPEQPGDLARAILDYLAQNGASFFAELVRASKTTHPRETLDALWELVWAGYVTNDTFGALRALAWPRRNTTPSPRSRSALVPPEAAGRWSLVRRDAPGGATSATGRAHAIALQLLERYGVVTRETVNAEGIPGGFGTVYPVLKAMEEAGRVRRGYFVDGLGAAQFALPGAVDRLRAERDPADDPAVAVLAATDPANPYGAAVPWPRRGDDDRRALQRAAGARVVLIDGFPVLYLERGGKSVLTLPGFEDGEAAALAIAALVETVADPRGRPFTLDRIDAVPAHESDHLPAFEAAGFAAGYRGIAYRAPKKEAAAVAGG